MSNQPNPSTLSFQSTTTFSSTSPLGRPAQPPQKDYAAALGVLQSRYGAGGVNVPNPKKEPSKKLPESSRSSHLAVQPASTGTPSTSTPQTSQTTLTQSSSTYSGTSEGSSSTSDQGRKSKNKKSILKSLFKGKAKTS